MKKSHPRSWTSKKEVLDTIKKLYFICDGDDNIEQLYILPSRWLFLLQYEKIGDAIHENFQNVSCTPIKFFVEENLDSWHTKTHGPSNYFQNSYLSDLIHKCGEKKNIHLQSFEILVQAEGQDHLRKKVITMELLSRLLIMKRHPNIRKVLWQISMPTSMHLWSVDVEIL